MSKLEEEIRALILRSDRHPVGTHDKDEYGIPSCTQLIAELTNALARDRAILALGFFGALRRAEVAALDVADLEFTDEGLILHIRKSKTGYGRWTGNSSTYAFAVWEEHDEQQIAVDGGRALRESLARLSSVVTELDGVEKPKGTRRRQEKRR